MLILDNATLVDLDAGELRPGHSVSIEADTIVSVDDRRPPSEHAERLDLHRPPSCWLNVGDIWFRR